MRFLGYLPPPETWTKEPNYYPGSNQEADANPSTAVAPVDNFFCLAFSDRKPGNEPCFFPVLFSECSFTTLCFAHDIKNGVPSVLDDNVQV